MLTTRAVLKSRAQSLLSLKGLFCVHRNRLRKNDVLALSRIHEFAELNICHCSIKVKCLYHLYRMRILKRLGIEC